MVTRPHSPWLVLTHKQRDGQEKDRNAGKHTWWGATSGCLFVLLFVYLPSPRGHLYIGSAYRNIGYIAECPETLSLFYFASCFSKNICQVLGWSQVLSRGSLTPTVPLLPQPLRPPLLSSPAALPLLCILHLPHYGAVSKHSTGVALNAVKSVIFLLRFSDHKCFSPPLNNHLVITASLPFNAIICSVFMVSLCFGPLLKNTFKNSVTWL